MSTVGENTFRDQVTLGFRNGLHLSPIQLLVKEANQFHSDLTLYFDGNSASAQSVLELMTLGATYGAVIDVEGVGPDCQEAVASVIRVLGKTED